MIRAKIINLCFQVLAAFWAVIVITRMRTTVAWHAYVLAAIGVIVISMVGTRLKHRIQERQKGSNSDRVAASRPS